MAQVVLVHGIAQQQQSADSLERDWLPDLAGGVRIAGYPQIADRLWRTSGQPGGISSRMAFYGDLFLTPGRQGADDADLSDEQRRLAERLAQDDPHVKVLHRPRKEGLGQAYLAGFEWGINSDYDVLVADGDHDGIPSEDDVAACPPVPGSGDNDASNATADPDGDPITYEWDFDMDGTVDSTEPNPTFTYEENGVFDATLKVTDSTGRSAAASVPIIIGNMAPVVELTTSPAPGEPFQFGQQVTYQVTVTDDSPVDCSTVTVGYILGHEEHGHPLSSTAGCTGTITTLVDSGHAGASNLSAVFVASYTDTPEDPNVPPLTGSDEVVLVPNP
jgi:hypothetical protein